MNLKRNKFVEKVISVLLNIMIIAFSIILLISIYNNIQVKILKNDYSSFFNYTIFEVETGSMSGSIEIGDWIIVKKTKDINLDDIVTYKQGDDYVTHRVIQKYNDSYVTKGDANNTKDNPIKEEAIVGKVVKTLPHFGLLRKTLFNPLVVISLIITLFFIDLAIKKDDPNKNKNLKYKIFNSLKKKLKKKNRKKILATDNTTTNFKRSKSMNITKNNENKMISKKINTESVEKKDSDLSKNDIKQIKNDISIDDEDLEKTMYFRMIQVSKNEIENTYSEINGNKEDKKDKEKSNEQIVEDMKEEDILENLELFQKKTKKCKNIIEKAMLIKNEELNEIIMLLNLSDKLLTNEATIKKLYLKAYIDAKYYNDCGDINVKYTSKDIIVKINKFIDSYASVILKSYKGKDTLIKDKITKFKNIFKVINYIEKYSSISDINNKKEKYKNVILKELNTDINSKDLTLLVNNIVKVQRKYNSMLNYSLDNMQSNMFKIRCSKIGDTKIYGTKLNHNLNFSKVYSNYIIDKTYNEGIIAEDKMIVLLNMLSVKIINNMYQGNFHNKYLIKIPTELYEKSNKLDNLFEMIEDEFAKNSVIVLLTNEEINKYGSVIKLLCKKGYKFACEFNEESNTKLLNIMEYIFIKEENKKIKKSIPKELHKKVIYGDVISKVS